MVVNSFGHSVNRESLSRDPGTMWQCGRQQEGHFPALNPRPIPVVICARKEKEYLIEGFPVSGGPGAASLRSDVYTVIQVGLSPEQMRGMPQADGSPDKGSET